MSVTPAGTGSRRFWDLVARAAINPSPRTPRTHGHRPTAANRVLSGLRRMIVRGHCIRIFHPSRMRFVRSSTGTCSGSRGLWRRLMIRALPEQLEADLIVPVPLHPSRLRAREFNQSLLMADRVGRYLMRPVSTTALVRTVATEPQTSLTRQERLRNLRRAFSVRNAEPFAGRRVLLIDDVFTTGTTLNECAKVLRSAGAASISALTLARTMDSRLVPDRLLAEHGARRFAGPRS